MSPQAETYGITIVPQVPSGARICQVIVAEVNPATMARMRASGQLDCGKRQAIIPLLITRLSESAATRLIDEFLANADTDALVWDDIEDARKAFRIILETDRRFEATQIDRNIPCQ